MKPSFPAVAVISPHSALRLRGKRLWRAIELRQHAHGCERGDYRVRQCFSGFLSIIFHFRLNALRLQLGFLSALHKADTRRAWHTSTNKTKRLKNEQIDAFFKARRGHISPPLLLWVGLRRRRSVLACTAAVYNHVCTALASQWDPNSKTKGKGRPFLSCPGVMWLACIVACTYMAQTWYVSIFYGTPSCVLFALDIWQAPR